MRHRRPGRRPGPPAGRAGPLDYGPKSTPKKMWLRVPGRAFERIERAHQVGIPVWPEEDGRLRRVTTRLGTLREVERWCAEKRWCAENCSERWAAREACACRKRGSRA